MGSGSGILIGGNRMGGRGIGSRGTIGTVGGTVGGSETSEGSGGGSGASGGCASSTHTSLPFSSRRWRLPDPSS